MSDAAREYGGALFELAEEKNVSGDILLEIKEISRFFEIGSDYIRLLSAPNVSVSERLDCIKSAFYGKANEYLCNFIMLMTERGRSFDIADSFKEYARRYNEYNKISIVTVKSAVALSPSQKAALKKKLYERTGKNIELECHVDSSLIGGMSVYIDGELLDGSISTHISNIRKNLLA